MCGICGYISKTNIEVATLEAMTDCLSHRGPDDRGIWTDIGPDGYSIGLGHRRLSILDCSPRGHQPMTDASGRYHIVFNGEIYNYKDIQRKLGNHSFVSTTDTEVLLYSYIQYGVKCLDILNGMFAFAIFDKEENTLFMARDRMGKKPLYYYKDRDQFLFASELKSIMAFPSFRRIIDKDSLVGYFAQNCILSPQTIFENTFKLLPGEYLIWRDGIVRKERYYSPVDEYLIDSREEIGYYSECKNKLREYLYDSIDKRLVADVPVGTFLSGGIDSTLVTAIAADIRGSKGLDTFTIGFSDNRYDESVFAARSAEHLGVRHHEKMMTEEDLLDTLKDLTVYYDEPFSDSSQLPTMLVSRFARESVTVVLSGDGGDELFAGYTNIDTLSRLRKLDRLMSCAAAMIPETVYHRLNRDAIRILLGKKSGIEKVQYYAKLREEWAKRILLNNKADGTVRSSGIDSISDWLQQRMMIDMTSYLPDEIMTKADRASMRYSLEMRCPLLDHRIVDLSLRIPMKYKYNKGIKKLILKDMLREFVPEEMMNRPKKGFGVPIYKWLCTCLYEQLRRYSDTEFLIEQGLFDPGEVKRLLSAFSRHDERSITQVVWGFYVFQQWYESYIRRD